MESWITAIDSMQWRVIRQHNFENANSHPDVNKTPTPVYKSLMPNSLTRMLLEACKTRNVSLGYLVITRSRMYLVAISRYTSCYIFSSLSFWVLIISVVISFAAAPPPRCWRWSCALTAKVVPGLYGRSCRVKWCNDHWKESSCPINKRIPIHIAVMDSVVSGSIKCMPETTRVCWALPLCRVPETRPNNEVSSRW